MVAGQNDRPRGMWKQFQCFFEQRRLAGARRADRIQSQCAARVQRAAELRRNLVIGAQDTSLDGCAIHISSI
jgi:hypothetical protein